MWMRDLATEGAALCAKALTEAECVVVEDALASAPAGVPGVRLTALSDLMPIFDADGAVGRLVARVLGPNVRPVRAVLFDKSTDNNWALGWHQDRTIVVQRRVDATGFGPWTIKAGLVQVEPPFALIAGMITVRLHLDPVDAGNAPLRIVPGSHRLGRIPEGDIAAVVDRLGMQDCLAERGDLWLYHTAIVHGSRAAGTPRRRRVLQVDYSADRLPEPLAWRGID